jgi:hypothetical protein
MAARSAPLLRALLVATLVSFLLMQGVAGVFEACFCSCYNDCKRNNPHLPNAKERCHWWCFKDSRCSFSCKNRGHRGQSSSDDGEFSSSFLSDHLQQLLVFVSVSCKGRLPGTLNYHVPCVFSMW